MCPRVRPARAGEGDVSDQPSVQAFRGLASTASTILVCAAGDNVSSVGWRRSRPRCGINLIGGQSHRGFSTSSMPGSPSSGCAKGRRGAHWKASPGSGPTAAAPPLPGEQVRLETRLSRGAAYEDHVRNGVALLVDQPWRPTDTPILQNAPCRRRQMLPAAMLQCRGRGGGVPPFARAATPRAHPGADHPAHALTGARQDIDRQSRAGPGVGGHGNTSSRSMSARRRCGRRFMTSTAGRCRARRCDTVPIARGAAGCRPLAR